MKLHNALLALLGAAVVSAQIQAPLHTANEEEWKVPGNNSLNFEHNPKDYVLQLHNIDLDPNPPLPGKPLNILATGHLTKVVDQGSFVHVLVKYGFITILGQDFDLCDNADKLEEKCPLHKGSWNISKQFELPKLIPAGKYTVEMQAYTDKTMVEKISCIKGDIIFKAQ